MNSSSRKCKYCGCEITEGIWQVVCRSCRDKNTSKKAKEYQKRKADKQYMLGFEHGYQQGKLFVKDGILSKIKDRQDKSFIEFTRTLGLLPPNSTDREVWRDDQVLALLKDLKSNMEFEVNEAFKLREGNDG